MKEKISTMMAVITLTLIIWLIGLLADAVIPGSFVIIRQFLLGFGLLATFGFIYTVIKEFGEF